MDFTKLKNKPFMLINFYHQPGEDQITSKKNWLQNSQWKTREHVVFVDRLNSDHFANYAIIIDLFAATVLKNRFINQVSNGQVYGHFVEKYKNQIAKAIHTWKQKRAQLLKSQWPIDVQKNIVVGQDPQQKQ